MVFLLLAKYLSDVKSAKESTISNIFSASYEQEHNKH